MIQVFGRTNVPSGGLIVTAEGGGLERKQPLSSVCLVDVLGKVRMKSYSSPKKWISTDKNI